MVFNDAQCYPRKKNLAFLLYYMRRLLYKSQLKLTKTAKTHLICWFIFISYEVIVSAKIVGTPKPFAYYFLFYILNICTFYFHSLYLLKRSSTNTLSDFWRIPLLTIIELAVYCLITFILSWTLYNWDNNKSLLLLKDHRYIALTIWRGIYFIMYGTGYYFLINYYQKKEKTMIQAVENEQLKNEVLRAEQDFLRAQINPHLLFNTLSFIKYAAKKRPDEADEAVMRLSNIMSFALEHNSEAMLLTKELDQVENIIGLNQLRHNHTLHINFAKHLENKEAVIIPIVLLTLVENIFKHGNLMDPEHPALINVESTQEYLLIQTINLLSQNRNVTSHHTGLTNIRARLDQFYKGSYEFHYWKDENLFKVDLKINL